MLAVPSCLLIFFLARYGFFDQEQAFTHFQEAECDLWQQKGINRRPGELVHVGGDVKSSKIAHRLHDPGFTTTKPDNGVCADGTSPCTQLVMANGYNEEGVLFDHCSRRESVDPFLYYTDDILACHERYLLQIRSNMLAPVEIAYGVPTWERTQILLQGNLQHFDLWGTCKGITIYLEWENIRANSNRLSRRLRRFLISAYHPQNMMRAWGKTFSANQDRLLETGYRLACVDFLEHFYERQLWRPIVRFLPHAHFSMNRALKLESIRALERLQTLRLEHEDSTTKAEARRRLRGLACALRKEEKGEKETKEWEKMEGVEGVEERETCGNAEAVMRLSSAKHTVASSGKPAVWDFSHLLDNENDVLQSPSEVECFCIACMGNTNHGTSGDPVVVDDKPRWTKTTPPKYSERRLKCKNCGKARRFIPIKADIPSLSDNQVRDFLRTHGGLSTEDQLLAFQSVLSASQNHRWQTPEGRQTRVDKIERYRRLMPQYLEKREGLKVHTMCSSCGRKGIDLSPCWLKGTEVYYAKQIVDCTAAKCQKIRTYMIPADESMRYKKHRNLLLQMNKDSAQLKDNTGSKRIATLESSPNRGRSKKT